MSRTLEYKGFEGSVQFSDEDRVSYGHVLFVPALVSYEGSDATSLRASFEEAADDHLELSTAAPQAP